MSSLSKQPISQPTWFTNTRILQEEIYKILVDRLKMELDPPLIKILFDNEAMINYWIPAFTHKTVDAANNYETLEFYGDKVLNYAFSQYLRDKFGGKLNQNTGTLLSNQYMSKVYQAELARKMGLVELMRYDPEEPKINVSVQEDAFEAFAGALNNLAEDRIKRGLGFIFIFNMLTALFEDEEIVLSEVRRDVKTELKEIYEKMGWGEPYYDTKENDNPRLGAKKSEIRSRTGDVLGTGYGSQDTAQFEAARNALATLAAQGITWKRADEIKMERNRKRNPEFERQYQRMQQAITALNEILNKSGKVQIVDFKLSNIDQRKVGAGMRHTYSIKVAYDTPNGMIWKDLQQKTGGDSDQTKVSLMKEFADRYVK